MSPVIATVILLAVAVVIAAALAGFSFTIFNYKPQQLNTTIISEYNQHCIIYSNNTTICKGEIPK